MTVYFADTSALAKRYLTEVGSSWVRSWIAPAALNTIIISELTPVEIFSLLERRRRDGSLTPGNVDLLRSDFLVHAQTEYLVIAVNSALFTQARRLVQAYPLRTLDAIQLAGALVVLVVAGTPVTFVSADKALLAAAAAEGFLVDDPNAHP